MSRAREEPQVPLRGMFVMAMSYPAAFVTLLITQSGATAVAFIITLLLGEAILFVDFVRTVRRSNRSNDTARS